MKINLMIPFQSAYKAIAAGLSRNSEALLVFGLALVAFGMFAVGMNQYVACLFSLSMYLLYRQRAEKSDKHAADMARSNVERTEAARRTRLEKAWNKTLQAQAKAHQADGRSEKEDK